MEKAMHRKRPCSVAIVGPDGAGKTTLIEGISSASGMPTKRIYLGVMLRSANVMLPTTRLMLAIASVIDRRPRDADSSRSSADTTSTRSFAARARTLLAFTVVLAEAWYRVGVARWFRFRGFIILFDRHFYLEHLAHRAVQNPKRIDPLVRLHGFLMRVTCPLPDLVIYLDAPAQILFARKGERSVEVLERWRQGYLQLADVGADFAIVDAAQSAEAVRSKVVAVIDDFVDRQSGGTTRSGRG